MNKATFTGLRVLAIDDEPFQLKLLTQQLKGLGVTAVKTCQEPIAALVQLQAEPGCVDLISCDLQMPGMDGIEFVRNLGQTGYRGGVMLISGEDRSVLQAAERLAASHALRVCGAFQKPVSGEQLLRALVAATQAPPASAASNPAPAKHQYTGDELAQAIAHGELLNHYQPKVDFATGRLVGAETLVRWQHPLHGMVFPDQFIGVAEQSGLIDDLTHAVLFGPKGALNQARAWQDAGMALQVAVNVSMDNLKDRSFPDEVAHAASAAGVAPSQLIIEVTESRMMRDAQAALDILTRLRLKRVGVSIDDFGTGHSSLAQLHTVPFDELKIDRGFVHGACRDASLRAILLPSLDMARQLGIKTVAEGVEDADDWHYLRSQGCTLAQGYFIARPMAPERLQSWAAEWESRRGALIAEQTAA
jgi:EAL domain-containing protein (putative c-di-GMP-specific phosphodiesterase class I)/FixJ family two-component response regulator